MMECIVRLYKLNMLPESILLMESEDPESARRRIPRPSNKARNSSAGSMLSRAFSRYYSLCFALVSRENDTGQKFALFSDHKGSLLWRQLVVVGGQKTVRLCAMHMRFWQHKRAQEPQRGRYAGWRLQQVPLCKFNHGLVATCPSLLIQWISGSKVNQRIVSCMNTGLNGTLSRRLSKRDTSNSEDRLMHELLFQSSTSLPKQLLGCCAV